MRSAASSTASWSDCTVQPVGSRRLSRAIGWTNLKPPAPQVDTMPTASHPSAPSRFSY